MNKNIIINDINSGKISLGIELGSTRIKGVLINNKADVLATGTFKWENKFVIPGGHIELGEKMEDALKREVLEETGLYIYDIKLISLKESIYSDKFHEKKHFIFIDYLCKTDSSDVVLNDESETYEWVDINKIEHYDLGGFTKELLLKLRNNNESRDYVKIFYNY